MVHTSNKSICNSGDLRGVGDHNDRMSCPMCNRRCKGSCGLQVHLHTCRKRTASNTTPNEIESSVKYLQPRAARMCYKAFHQDGRWDRNGLVTCQRCCIVWRKKGVLKHSAKHHSNWAAYVVTERHTSLPQWAAGLIKWRKFEVCVKAARNSETHTRCWK